MHRDAIGKFAVVVGLNVFEIIVERKAFEHRLELVGSICVFVRQRLENLQRFDKTNPLVVFFGKIKQYVHQSPFFFV